MRARVWTVVLAGGRGRRLASVTGGIPKQFWRPHGESSFLEVTLDRTASVSPPQRTLVVVDRTHAHWVQALPGVSRQARVLFQCCDRGTAAGVLLGVSAVLADDPNAIVFVTPADHGIGSPAVFADGVEQTIDEVRRRRRDVVLFGVEASTASTDYGWIAPSRKRGPRGLSSIRRFVEKPPLQIAQALLSQHAVWNTMILVARARRLDALFARHLPAMSEAFARESVLTDREPGAAECVYDRLTPADFSRDLLSRAEGLSVYTWPSALGWSDLGTPERLQAWETLASSVTGEVPGTGPTVDRMPAATAPR